MILATTIKALPKPEQDDYNFADGILNIFSSTYSLMIWFIFDTAD